MAGTLSRSKSRKLSATVTRAEFKRLEKRVNDLAQQVETEIRQIAENVKAREVQFTRIAQMQVDLDRLRKLLTPL
jgi:hypothetical protein